MFWKLKVVAGSPVALSLAHCHMRTGFAAWVHVIARMVFRPERHVPDGRRPL